MLIDCMFEQCVDNESLTVDKKRLFYAEYFITNTVFKKYYLGLINGIAAFVAVCVSKFDLVTLCLCMWILWHFPHRKQFRRIAMGL